MSFAPEYRVRYEQVIEPAISSIPLNGTPLKPHRVDISKSGDSILTDIMEGVSHSRMILADVSSVGKDSKTGDPYRNGNVMYEVGLALACRQPSDVLLVRDDKDNFLFDVSMVPHKHLDFTDTQQARISLEIELRARLQEQNYHNDARVKLAVASLSNSEIEMLLRFDRQEVTIHGWEVGGTVLSIYEAGIMRLLDKRLIELAGKFKKGFPGYRLTQLGRTVAETAKSNLPQFYTEEVIDEPSKDEGAKPA